MIFRQKCDTQNTLKKHHCHTYVYHPKSPGNEHPHPNPSIIQASTHLSEASLGVVDFNSNQNVCRTEYFSSSRLPLSFPFQCRITTLVRYILKHIKMNIPIPIQASYKLLHTYWKLPLTWFISIRARMSLALSTFLHISHITDGTL